MKPTLVISPLTKIANATDVWGDQTNKIEHCMLAMAVTTVHYPSIINCTICTLPATTPLTTAVHQLMGSPLHRSSATRTPTINYLTLAQQQRTITIIFNHQLSTTLLIYQLCFCPSACASTCPSYREKKRHSEQQPLPVFL